MDEKSVNEDKVGDSSDFYANRSSSSSNEDSDSAENDEDDESNDESKKADSKKKKSKGKPDSDESDETESPLHPLEEEKYHHGVHKYVSKYRYLDTSVSEEAKKQTEKEGISKTIKAATQQLSSHQGGGKKRPGPSTEQFNFNKLTHAMSQPSLTNLNDNLSSSFVVSSVTPVTSAVSESNIKPVMKHFITCEELQQRRRKSNRSKSVERDLKQNISTFLSQSVGLADFEKQVSIHEVTQEEVREVIGHRLAHKTSGGHAPECPPERLNFFKTLSLLIRMGNPEKARGNGKSYVRLDSQEKLLYQKESKDILWLHLQSWYSGVTLVEQDNILSRKRHVVHEILEELLNFSIEDKTPNQLTSEEVAVIKHESIEDSDKKDSVPTLKELVDCSQKEFGSLVGDNRTITESSEMEKASADPTEKELEKSHFECFLPSANDARMTSKDSFENLHEFEEKYEGSCKSAYESISQRRPHISPFNFSRQVSIDESLCINSMTDDQCECSDTLSELCQFCIIKETEAFQKVEKMLEKLDEVEQLYPCTKVLGEEVPLYNSVEVVTRIKTLNQWYNIMRDLRQKINLLAKMFGIKNKMKVGWPCYDPQEVESCLNDDKEKDTSSYSSVVGKTRPGGAFSPKIVQFKGVNSGDNSPNTSSSDKSTSELSRTCSSVPVSPEVFSGNPLSTPESSISSFNKQYLDNFSCNKFKSTSSGSSKYRKFVDKSLRHKGLRNIYSQLSSTIRPLLHRVHATLKRPSPSEYPVLTEPPTPLSRGSDSLLRWSREYLEELSKYGVWSETYQQMCLPTFHRPFLFLLRVLLDVVHECLKLRLEQQPDQPSSLSIGQLIKECKEVLRAGVHMRQRYTTLAQTVLGEGCTDVIEAQLDAFDDDLKKMLEIYLQYLGQRTQLMQMGRQVSLRQKNYLEEEWSFVRVICPNIPGGEALAANKFCFMASDLLNSIGDHLECEIDECFTFFHENVVVQQENISHYKKGILQTCRMFKKTFEESSHQARQAVAFAKALRKDLEIAAEFKALVSSEELLRRLQETGHMRVIAPHSSSHVMFVPGYLKGNEHYIWQLVDMTCGHGECSGHFDQDGYLLMMQYDPAAIEDLPWMGPTVVLEPTAQATISLSHVEVDGLLLVSNNFSQLTSQCRKFQKSMGNSIHIDKQQTSCNHAIAEALNDLKVEALNLREKIVNTLQLVEERLDVAKRSDLEDHDRSSLQAQCKEVLHQGYKFGFEYQRAVTRLITGDAKTKLGKGLISFALQWMKFVSKRCERGRGQRPRWANQGLEFLITACDPMYLQTLSSDEFQGLKHSMHDCIKHLVGSVDNTQASSYRSPNSSLTPPSISYSTNFWNQFSLSSSLPTKDSSVNLQTTEEGFPPIKGKRSKEENGFSTEGVLNEDSGSHTEDRKNSRSRGPPIWHVRVAVAELETRQQEQLEAGNVIGHVRDIHVQKAPIRIGARRVTFPWQRGFKIGEGRFGKVYTAVNNLTGELIAMKEINLQPNDHRAIKEAIDEIRTFEGIKHPNLIRYYGVEIHREEMLIFMEYCNEGSLESAAQLNIPESLVRKYTRQLLEAVSVLHDNGIVHRDIKILKLGDFGCCIKLMNHTTMPGELCGLVGTPAYMAPEVFTRNITEGHGRAADIWSVGCVVLEMSSGRRPWHDLENSYQIMFRVGMGEVPEIPDSLSEEGQDFLDHCLQHDPQNRSSASQLLDHPFTKVNEEDDG
ncbi:mitogen-activated protein kinase kinase kinase 4-like isoform X2 [Tachypleus tridentatus]|uniref:mitogen-activated protein kinase kinase kinase 4-like isoform X2 n=1 Tax=Tachypleus tridentatus TaxID=6853 RepID=UPI003FD11227